jgi:hypothetical protein
VAEAGSWKTLKEVREVFRIKAAAVGHAIGRVNRRRTHSRSAKRSLAASRREVLKRLEY